MGKIKISEVDHIAKLANLKISEKEKKMFAKQLSEVVDYIEELKKINTNDVIPTSQTTGLENTTREDVVSNESLGQEMALSNAKNTHNGYFVVNYLLKERSLE